MKARGTNRITVDVMPADRTWLRRQKAVHRLDMAELVRAAIEVMRSDPKVLDAVLQVASDRRQAAVTDG